MLKQHILHVIESLEFGGAEKVVVHLANKLSVQHKVSICLTKNTGELAKQLLPGITIYYLDSGEGNNFSTPFKIAKIIKEHKVDILHSHNWSVFLESSIAALLVPKVSLLHTIHGKYSSKVAGIVANAKSSLRALLERALATRCYRMVAVSNSIKDYIKNDLHIAKDKCVTIHNGITDIALDIKPNNSDKIRLITVGRLAKIKNQVLMLEAFAIAFKENPKLSLTFLGDGPELENLTALTNKLGIDEHVVFLGFRTDVHEILNESDVFLLSSDYEGISIALLEAMSLSLPAISTDVGGISETILEGQTGFLVEQGNIENYARAISKLTSDIDNVKLMGKAARALFLKQFQEDMVIDQYNKIYLEDI